MIIRDLAKVICEPDSAEENIRITVKTMEGRTLWQGKAKDLKLQIQLYNWLVVEMLVDETSVSNHMDNIPRYNWGKILIVV